MTINFAIKASIVLAVSLLSLAACKKDLPPIKNNLTVREAVLSGGFMQIPVKIGTPLQINLAVNPGNIAVTEEATYTSKHPEIASYSKSGVITGLTVGVDTVIINTAGLQVWYMVNVSK